MNNYCRVDAIDSNLTIFLNKKLLKKKKKEKKKRESQA
jgi:hypothetical protein